MYQFDIDLLLKPQSISTIFVGGISVVECKGCFNLFSILVHFLSIAPWSLFVIKAKSKYLIMVQFVISKITLSEGTIQLIESGATC